MRGIKTWNFPAFDEAAEKLRANGWAIVSPAELDRAMGFNEHLGTLPEGFIEGALRRDIEALLTVDSIILLPGWEKSSGVAIELTVARALGLRRFLYIDGDAVEVFDVDETVLTEAERLVGGDRGAAYGHPADDLTRTGRLWAAILDMDDIPAWKVALCMVGLKVSREVNSPKRDNLVDMAGYTKVVSMIYDRLPR